MLDDAIADGQAQADAYALWLGGKEWFKEAILEIEWNTRAVVRDLQADITAADLASNSDVTALFEGLGRIEQHIQHDLPELMTIATHQQGTVELDLEGGVLHLDTMAHEGKGCGSAGELIRHD